MRGASLGHYLLVEDQCSLLSVFRRSIRLARARKPERCFDSIFYNASTNKNKVPLYRRVRRMRCNKLVRNSAQLRSLSLRGPRERRRGKRGKPQEKKHEDFDEEETIIKHGRFVGRHGRGISPKYHDGRRKEPVRRRRAPARIHHASPARRASARRAGAGQGGSIPARRAKRTSRADDGPSRRESRRAQYGSRFSSSSGSAQISREVI
jgi:hypothetical protein